MADGFNETPVRGKRLHNSSPTDATSVATLPAVATNADPAFTEGNVVHLSTDLAGNLRVVLSGTEAGTATAVDVTDRVARALGVVSLDAASLAALESIDLNAGTITSLRDISDRAARALGIVALDTASLAALESIDLNAATITSLRDQTDRVARILGQLTVRGAVLSDTNPLPVVTQENPGVTRDSGLLTTANVAPGASTTLSGVAVGASLTGKLLEVTASSSVRIKVEVRANAVTQRVFFCDPVSGPFVYSPKDRDLLTVAATQVFSVVLTNMDNLRTADVYASISQVEV